jgi:hypothetical protein
MASRKAAVAGSTAIQLDKRVAHMILSVLRELDDTYTEVLLRRPRGSWPSPFETLVSSLASAMGFTVTWFAPTTGGRSATYLRDVQMVAAADQVFAFFPEGSEMTGGTGHVVEKALDQGRPVAAYAITDDGLRWVGGADASTID